MAAVSASKAEVELCDVEIAGTGTSQHELVTAETTTAAAPYYWEEPAGRVRPWYLKSWHNAYYYGTKAVDGAEVVGEVVANFLGLTQSKYQYVIDAMEIEQARKEQREREEMAREEAEAAEPVPAGSTRRASALEGGMAPA